MPLLWLSVAFMTGIIIGSTVRLSWLFVAVGFLLGVGAGYLERRKFAHFSLVERWQKISQVPAGFLLAAIMAGVLRYQVSMPVWTNTDLAWYNDVGTVQVRGWISAPPDPRDRIDLLEITAEEIAIFSDDEHQKNYFPVDGKLIAMVRAGRDWQYGDEVFSQARWTPRRRLLCWQAFFWASRPISPPTSRMLFRKLAQPILSPSPVSILPFWRDCLLAFLPAFSPGDRRRGSRWQGSVSTPYWWALRLRWCGQQ